MSFETYARRVTDDSAPYGRRITALAGCVQLYRPLGYQATFGFLHEVSGPFRRDETAVLRAMGALTASRRLWLAELDADATRRTAAKHCGRRTPRPSDTNPSRPVRWYGDSRRAAAFTLGFLLRQPDRIAYADADVIRLASAVLDAPGDAGRARPEHLAVLRRSLERRREASAWPNVDRPNWLGAGQSLWVLHQISTMTDVSGG